jgi:tripartite-type tricarboxylate transporter receptor subunit TctC
MNRIAASIALAFTACLCGLACAQPYPAKAIRMVVGFAPGGGTDLVARIIGAKMNESWGQLNGEVNRIMQLPDAKAKLEEAGTQMDPMSPEQFATFLRSEIVKYAKLVKAANVTLD